MAQFIELIDHEGKDFILNTSYMVRIFPADDGSIIFLAKDSVSGNTSISVKNKYSDIKMDILQ